MSEEWTWELASKAQADLDGLSAEDRDRVINKLDEIVSSPWRDPRSTVNRFGTARIGRSGSETFGSQ